jgi:ABC-type sugar transport system permease subunit
LGVDRVAYLLILPNILIYALFQLGPVIWTVVLSFTDYNLFRWQWTGVRNYTNLLKDAFFVTSVRNTALYSVGYIVPAMSLGLVLALILNRSFRGRTFYRTVLYLPYVISIVAASMAWLYIYDSTGGLLNRLLEGIGLQPRNWLFDTALALPSIIGMSVWHGYGYSMVVYLSGLQTIPQDLYEAATIDGASGLRKFLSVTWPLLAPATFFLLVMSVIFSFQVFGQVYIMTKGGPANATTTVVHQIYENGFQGFRMGYASAMAVVLLLATCTVVAVNFRYGSRSGSSEMT